jgi:hypothetical protein
VTGRAGTPGLKLGDNGLPVVSRLEEDRLRALAETGGGRYVSLNSNDRTILELRNEFTGLEQSLLGSEAAEIKEEQLHWFAFPAILLLAAEWLLQVFAVRVPSPMAVLRRLAARP